MKQSFVLIAIATIFLGLFFSMNFALEAENISSPFFEKNLSKEKKQKLEEREIKVLVLIIASDDLPVYLKLQQIWKSYMHLDPKHVEAYFIRGDPHLDKTFEIEGETIWCQCEENLIPGVLDKTLLSMQAMLPRIQSEFDYVLRTNLSSFYVFPGLINFLKTLPKTNCCCAVRWTHFGIKFPQGAGIIFSPDYVEMLLQKQEFLDRYSFTDDIAIGSFFEKEKISIIPAPRLMFQNIQEYLKVKKHIPKNIFHFRVKNSNPEKRLNDDIRIHTELLNTYYQIVLPDFP